MAEATIGKWGKNLAVRLPQELARTAGLREGERVEIESRDGTLIIRRPAEDVRAAARQAADELLALRREHGVKASAADIKTWIGEGRR